MDKVVEVAAMHDVMRARLMRKLEALPEEKLYQVLDFIEFLETKHSPEGPSRARGLQRLAERLEDGLRTRRLSPRTIGRAMTVVGTAGRVVDTVAAAGREAVRTGRAILAEVESTGAAGTASRTAAADPEVDDAGATSGERAASPHDAVRESAGATPATDGSEGTGARDGAGDADRRSISIE